MKDKWKEDRKKESEDEEKKQLLRLKEKYPEGENDSSKR